MSDTPNDPANQSEGKPLSDVDRQSSSDESRGGTIPLWVALAGLVVALVIAVIIMGNVLNPLEELIFPIDAQAPIPAEAVLIREIEDTRTSDGEWLYGIAWDGCQLAQYFLEQNGTCSFTPFACQGDPESDAFRLNNPGDSPSSVATCIGGEEGVINSYSWEALISSGYSDYQTKFRVYLYKER